MVIVHLYLEEGPDCVKKLNGMFAFAICDLRDFLPILLVARDHFCDQAVRSTEV